MEKSLHEIQKISLLVAPFFDVLACTAAGAVRFVLVKGAADIPGDAPEPQSHPQGDGCSCTTSALQSSLFPFLRHREEGRICSAMVVCSQFN